MGKVAPTLLAAWLCLACPTLASAQHARWRPGPPPASPPSAGAVQEARERNAKALKLYQEEGAVDAALAEMERAYDLAPSYRLLYNIGQMARTARDYALALHAYERYLADGGEEVPEKRRHDLPTEIKELRSYVATLDIRVTAAGAKVFVDDVPVGTSPMRDKVVVNAGRVRVRAALGAEQDSEQLIVPGGDQVTVELQLMTSAGQPSDGTGTASGTTPVEPADDSGSGMSPYLWIGFGAAALLGVGAAVTGGVALSKSTEVDDTRFAGAEPPDELASTQDAARALALTTDVLIAAAGTALVVTVALAIAGVGSDDAPAAEATQTAWSVSPFVTWTPDAGTRPAGAGLGLRRSW